MSLRRSRPARPAPRGGPRRPTVPRDGGFLSVEWVLTLPMVFLLGALLVAAGHLVRDVLILQEAARSGARVAAVTTGTAAPQRAAVDAAPELDGLHVGVVPAQRVSGDQVEVVVRVTRRYGPLTHQLRARSVARVEPTVDDARRPTDPGAVAPDDGGPAVPGWSEP